MQERNSKGVAIKTCLNRFLGHCEGCKRDYNQNHHPNNIDCPNYQEMAILIVNVVDIKET